MRRNGNATGLAAAAPLLAARIIGFEALKISVDTHTGI